MALSDRERKILSEIESQLATEDPKFASKVATLPRSFRRAKLRYGIVGLIVGLVMLLAIVVDIVWGFAGFVVMLISAVVVLNQLKILGEDRGSDLGGQLRGGLSKYMEGRRRTEQDD